MNNNVIINELNAHLLEIQTRALEFSDWMIANKDSEKDEIVYCKEMYQKAYNKLRDMREDVNGLLAIYMGLTEDLNQMREYAFFYKE